MYASLFPLCNCNFGVVPVCPSRRLALIGLYRDFFSLPQSLCSSLCASVLPSLVLDRGTDHLRFDHGNNPLTSVASDTLPTASAIAPARGGTWCFLIISIMSWKARTIIFCNRTFTS